MRVNFDDEIKDIKDRIQDREGFPPDIQHLFFNEIFLEDDKTLSDYLIENGSTLHFRRRWKGGFQIFVKKYPTNETITLDVEAWNSICIIKKQIRDKINISPHKQILIFNSQSLEDHQSLNDYSIDREYTLHLVINEDKYKDPISINVLTMHEEIIHLIVDSNHSVKNIKERIYNATGIDWSRQILIYSGIELEDNQLLNKYNLKDNSNLVLKEIPINKKKI